MRGFLIVALPATLGFGFVGCGEEGPDLSKPEGAVEAFLAAVQDKDREALSGLVMDPQYVDVLWPLISEKGLAVSGGYVLVEGDFGTTVSFEKARYTENGSAYDLELTLSEDNGKWVISGYLTVLAAGQTTPPEDDPGAAALAYLQANYTDEVKAISDRYADEDFGGDVQYYIRFVDGKFDRINSVATGHGDDRAYNNGAFRAELDELVETFRIDAPGELDVF